MGTGGNPGGSGKLVICGTPIGNMGDMGQRAIETLAEADVVYAEDTRVITVSADAVQIESLIVAPFIALPVLLFLLVILLVNGRKRYDDDEDDKRNSNETN